jgi:hypothetical protein
MEYLRLWRAGKLDSPEMAHLMADWCTWQRLVGVSIEEDPEFQELLKSPCLTLIADELRKSATLECDPQVNALVQLFMKACGHGSKDAPGAAAAH